jgi:peptidoglycan/xylan/chitin deacetylase (PgdA/CDA1 family)
LFDRHLEVIAQSGATVLTISELAAALRRRELPDFAVAITFDDGYASVADAAAGKGIVGTVFCVAGRLGAWNDWPSQPASTPRLRLADAARLRELASAGWEIGSHGLDHNVLVDGSEFAASRQRLEGDVGIPVRSFAFPYGVVPPGAGRELARAGYQAGCTTRLAVADDRSDPFVLPRVDAHYLRRPAVLEAVLAERFDLYLRARACGARIRRLVRKDYAGS